MTMGNMGLSCTLAPTYGWTSKSQSNSSFVFNKKRNDAIVKHKPQTYVAEPTFPEHIKMRHTTKMRPTIVKKTFQIWFGTGISNMLQRGQHQRLVLTQMGNQLQAGGQVFKDCFIQCRSYFIPFTVDDKYSTAVFLMTEPKHHLHCNHRVTSNDNKFF